MVRHDPNSRLVGYLLMGLGALFLLNSLGWFEALWSLLWSIAFLGGGAAFIGLYYTDHRKWWALIPGFALLALAGAVILGDLAGAAFLGLLGAGFVAVYLSDYRRWWAIIPGGTLLSLALVAGADELFPNWDGGSLLFLGLAVTFTTLHLLPEAAGRQQWSLYPAIGCLALVIISSSFLGGAWSTLWPLVLIGGGSYLIWQQRDLRRRS